jgi:8-oxo-dGTP pyrophosphatase MutT (NUDIX family)
VQPDDAKLQKWQTLTEAVVFETPWFKIRKQHMRTPDGAELDYYIHDTNDSVICVCVSADNKVLVEQQYRPPVGKVSFDYPAGRMEQEDLTSESAMLRELREETGFQATSIKKLAVLDKDSGFSTTRLHVFLARGAIGGEATPEETESIVTGFLEPAEVLELITSGKMVCTHCVSATFFAFQELGWLKAVV